MNSANQHESIVGTYREMIDYYLSNIGKKSKYTNYRTKITTELIVSTVKRFNEIAPDYSQIILNGDLEDVTEKDPN
tara:strand:+ start:266 stop:493 length:228 start_codon:yes stop_codon:yes gene_type:complete